VNAEDRLTRRLAYGFAIAALAWSGWLVIAAFVVPIYTSQSGAASGPVFTHSHTLVEENGAWAASIPVAALVLAAMGGFGLHRKLHGKRAPGGSMAWIAVTGVTAIAVVTIASGGIFLIPTAILLLVAALVTPSPHPGADRVVQNHDGSLDDAARSA
jgi:hypothetical protein